MNKSQKESASLSGGPPTPNAPACEEILPLHVFSREIDFRDTISMPTAALELGEFLPAFTARIAEAWWKTWAIHPEGKRGSAVFGRNREGPPVKRPKSFPKPKRLSAGRSGRNSVQFNVPGREGDFALR